MTAAELTADWVVCQQSQKQGTQINTQNTVKRNTIVSNKVEAKRYNSKIENKQEASNLYKMQNKDF